MSSFFRSLGSKKKSKSSLALSDGSDWGGNKTGGSWPASDERRLLEGKDEEDISEKSSNVPPVRAVISAPGPSDARRAYKRCHGKCVQKFCLPVTSLSVFDECTAKCGGICTQK